MSPCIEDIFGIAQGKKAVVVLSAMAGVTNDLLEHKKTRQPGIYKLFEDQENYPRKMLTLRDQLIELNESLVDCGLDVDEANDFIGDRIDLSINILRSMENVLASGYVSRGELLLAARELWADPPVDDPRPGGDPPEPQ